MVWAQRAGCAITRIARITLTAWTQAPRLPPIMTPMS